MDSNSLGDLFASATRPHLYVNAGYKDNDTGRAAARDMDKHLGRVQKLVLNLVADRGPLGSTSEEGSAILEMAYAVIQPRFSELKAKGLIVDSKVRRTNRSSGKRAVVFVLAKYASADTGPEVTK